MDCKLVTTILTIALQYTVNKIEVIDNGGDPVNKRFGTNNDTGRFSEGCV
jgi:hypothetical protein